jgi:hypothetical protein
MRKHDLDQCLLACAQIKRPIAARKEVVDPIEGRTGFPTR